MTDATCNFAIDFVGIPIGVFRVNRATKNYSCRFPHSTGNSQSFDFRLLPKNFSHCVVHNFPVWQFRRHLLIFICDTESLSAQGGKNLVRIVAKNGTFQSLFC